MSQLPPDGLPASLVNDPSRPQRFLAFSGYLGESHLRDHVRLYLDEELREWFDVLTDDIEHASQYDEAGLPRTVIWVDQRTTLERRLPQPEDLQGEYLDGGVAADTVKQSAMSVALDYSRPLRTPAKTPWCH